MNLRYIVHERDVWLDKDLEINREEERREEGESKWENIRETQSGRGKRRDLKRIPLVFPWGQRNNLPHN